MSPLLRKLLGMNWVIVGLMLALSIFGVIAIYSCTYMRDNPAYTTMWHKQAVWVGISSIIFLVTSLVDYRWIRWGALPFYLVATAFLILTLVIGVKLEGARSWLRFGPIQFQPAQFAVLAGILVLGLFLSQFRNLHPINKILATGVVAGAPALLVLIQPDLGSTLIWVPVVFFMLYMARVPKRYLITMLIMGVMAMPITYYMALKPYQQKRIIAFIDPDVDPLSTGWAINQVMIAVGSGGWGGKGFLAKNSQVELGLVPSTTVPNDYIYAAIGEQWGFRGGVVLISAFAGLLISCLFVAMQARDRLGQLVCVGIMALIFTHTVQNIGMNVSILPVTGVPLPLISYSGSFVAVIMFGLGIVNSIWIHRKALP